MTQVGRLPTALGPPGLATREADRPRTLGSSRFYPPTLTHGGPKHGVRPEVLRELLGHADIRTTMIYTAVDRQALDDAVDALELHQSGLGRL